MDLEDGMKWEPKKKNLPLLIGQNDSLSYSLRKIFANIYWTLSTG